MALLKIKRRASGAAGAPSSLKSGELAYNEVDNTLYIGCGDDGTGTATSIKAIGGIRDSGSYTPTYPGGGTNITSITPALAQYMRQDDQVIVTGTVSIVAAAVSTDTQFMLSLPPDHPSNFSIYTDVTGLFSIGQTGYMGSGGIVYGDTTNDMPRFRYYATSSFAGGGIYYYMYRYIIK